MSHYYCSEHTDNADSRCITCEAAREWVEKDSTISTLQARINALTAEVEEQARLLGTSGSREAELLARIEALREANRQLHGELATLLTRMEALEKASNTAVADYKRWVLPQYGAVDGLDELAALLQEPSE